MLWDFGIYRTYKNAVASVFIICPDVVCKVGLTKKILTVALENCSKSSLNFSDFVNWSTAFYPRLSKGKTVSFKHHKHCWAITHTPWTSSMFKYLKNTVAVCDIRYYCVPNCSGGLNSNFHKMSPQILFLRSAYWICSVSAYCICSVKKEKTNCYKHILNGIYFAFLKERPRPNLNVLQYQSCMSV